jgi:hypothetical protein
MNNGVLCGPVMYSSIGCLIVFPAEDHRIVISSGGVRKSDLLLWFCQVLEERR